MAAGNTAISEAPVPTSPTLNRVVTFLSHFVSQTKILVPGITSAGHGSGRGSVLCFFHGGGGGRGRNEALGAVEAAEVVGVEVGLP